MNTDGKTCKTCYTNFYGTVAINKVVRKSYRLKPQDGTCLDQTVDNCLVHDENGLCTECSAGFQIVDGDCQPVAAETPIGQYGCKTFTDN